MLNKKILLLIIVGLIMISASKKESELTCWVVEKQECVPATGDVCIPFDSCISLGDPYCGVSKPKMFGTEQHCLDYLASLPVEEPLVCEWYEVESNGECIFDRYWIFIAIIVVMAAELMGIGMEGGRNRWPKLK